MAGQLIPPPELAPRPAPADSTLQQRLLMWLDMIASGERLLEAGLRSRAGPNGDWKAEYRRLYQMQRDDRLEKRIRRDAELRQRRKHDANC